MRSRHVSRGLVIAALGLGLTGSIGADSVFLKLGEIKGEATAAGHEGEIEILSWSWGAANPATIGTTSGGLSAGKVAITDLTLMKLLDSATPKLFEFVARGTRTSKAVLIARKEGDRPFDYLRITLEDVLVSSLQLSAASERPSESVSLSFGKVTVEYRPQLPTGAAGTWIPSSWDLRTLTP